MSLLHSSILFNRGRLKHGRHFTFKSVLDAWAVTFVSPAVVGSFVDATCPFASRGPWLQIFIPEDFLNVIADDVADLADPDEVIILFLLSSIFYTFSLMLAVYLHPR